MSKSVVSKRRDSVFHLNYDEKENTISVERSDRGRPADIFRLPLVVMPPRQLVEILTVDAKFSKPKDLLKKLSIDWEAVK